MKRANWYWSVKVSRQVPMKKPFLKKITATQLLLFQHTCTSSALLILHLSLSADDSCIKSAFSFIFHEKSCVHEKSRFFGWSDVRFPTSPSTVLLLLQEMTLRRSGPFSPETEQLLKDVGELARFAMICVFCSNHVDQRLFKCMIGVDALSVNRFEQNWFYLLTVPPGILLPVFSSSGLIFPWMFQLGRRLEFSSPFSRHNTWRSRTFPVESGENRAAAAQSAGEPLPGADLFFNHVLFAFFNQVETTATSHEVYLSLKLAPKKFLWAQVWVLFASSTYAWLTSWCESNVCIERQLIISSALCTPVALSKRQKDSLEFPLYKDCCEKLMIGGRFFYSLTSSTLCWARQLDWPVQACTVG